MPPRLLKIAALRAKLAGLCCAASTRPVAEAVVSEADSVVVESLALALTAAEEAAALAEVR